MASNTRSDRTNAWARALNAPAPNARVMAPPALTRRAARAARSVLRMGHPAVRAMLTNDQAPTCSLVEFVDAWNEDPNLVWQVRTGHLIHLLEAAVARIETLEASLRGNRGGGRGHERGESAQ